MSTSRLSFALSFATLALAVAAGCPECEENVAPVAALSASPLSGDAPLTVSFDASASDDPNGEGVFFEWDFGDGATADSGEVRSHTYNLDGVYTASVIVSDERGLEDTASVTITVGDVAEDGGTLAASFSTRSHVE